MAKEESSPGTIRVGIAGWDYPDWRGTVYPAGSGACRDRLAYVAGFVDVIEINSTFYRPNAPESAEGWAARTERQGTRFSAKSHRSWTHDPDADLTASIQATLQGLAPLRDAGRLSTILVQFPQSFHRTPSAFERMERIVEGTSGWPLTFEVRHSSWDREEVFDWLAERGAGWCAVDQPLVGNKTLGVRARATGATGYLRLHGRNHRDWFRPDAGRDRRYDYRYAMEELAPLAEAAQALAAESAEVLVVQNNHFRGQALANTIQLKHLISGTKPPAPQALVETYPDLEQVATVRRERLF
ncbi:hypothetical protein ABI59_23805 [Acidobacteria bacterium Mor1]|nr:hypothetical protein ABI59_23805 [Acidobacteria bacterium Mor1]